MKKRLLSLISVIGLAYNASSQCAVTSAPNNNCNYGFNITAFTLGGVASVGNSACGAGGYNSFATPVRTLLMGQTYAYSVTFGSSYNAMGFAIWIDLNGNNNYDATEMIAVHPYNYVSGFSGNITIPFTATPGTGRRMRIRHCSYVTPNGNNACTSYLGYYGEVEDYFVDIVNPPPCAGTPAANSVTGPTYNICPGSSAILGLANTYTFTGISYQWQASNLSAVGPWTTITTATTIAYTTPTLSTNMYYSAIITCANGGGSIIATPYSATVAPVTISQVPYNEGFEGIAFNNQLPNCSWLATNMPSVTRTYTSTLNANRQARTGSRYAAFYAYFVNNTSYFYTNGIQMNAGVTYSASVWYTTEYYGYTNVTNLSLMVGPNQSTTGLTTIVSASPAASPVYKSLSGTFTVPSTGIYYVALKGTSNGNYGTQYLSWDDLSVIIPCSLNSSTVSLSASSTTICSGQPVNITASGADTYSWNTSATGAVLNDVPNANFNYVVVGTNTLTGCSTSASQYVVVNPSPQVLVFADAQAVCPGTPVNLTALGSASSYTWSNASNLSSIVVTPTVNSVYTVLGSNAFGCQASASQTITMLPTPTISAVSSAPVQMCAGETQTLTGNGAATYQWAANTLFIQSATAIIAPSITTTYTLTGINAAGCSAKTTLTQIVDACVGLNEITTTLSGVKLYPNPTAGLFTIELNNGLNKTVEVTDITGRVILTNTSKEGKVNVNINALSNGVYYVKIQSDNAAEVIKVVKQ